jgi:Flp pilus assembly protein TadG
LAAHVGRLQQARDKHDRGASAIELAIITAILVGLAAAVLLIITTVVNQRKQEINNNNSTVP